MAQTDSPNQVIQVKCENEDEVLPCSLCEKTFYNSVALRNHWSIYHVNALEAGNEPSSSTSPRKTTIRNKKSSLTEQQLELRPVNLASLASEDVSYIIIKSEEGTEKYTPRKRAGDGTRKPHVKRERQCVPLKGPFECLQPSSLVGDATCHQIFFSCCDYSSHFRDEHTKRRKGLRCQVCEKPLIPGVGELYTCQVCEAGFNTNKELNLHIDDAHEQLRPFQCTECRKRFSQHGGLVQHMRMHTGERPFSCQVCTKAFTQKSGLDQHIRTHTKSKPYRCVVCGKTFCQSIHMKQHMRIHTNVSPFQCALCQKRFKQSSHLNYHLRCHDKSQLTEEQQLKLAELLAMSEGHDGDEVVLMGNDEEEQNVWVEFSDASIQEQ